MTLAIFFLGLSLIVRPFPCLLLPTQRKEQDFLDVLETFVDQARSGMPTPFALQSALDISFLPNQNFSIFLYQKFAHDPLAQQFALMWENLHRRGEGIVEGAEALARIGRDRDSQDEELRAKTSGARTTFRLLVLLPVWFLLLGQLVGLPALSVLLSHPWGYLLITFAAVLMWSANRWMKKILAAV